MLCIRGLLIGLRCSPHTFQDDSLGVYLDVGFWLSFGFSLVLSETQMAPIPSPIHRCPPPPVLVTTIAAAARQWRRRCLHRHDDIGTFEGLLAWGNSPPHCSSSRAADFGVVKDPLRRGLSASVEAVELAVL